MRDRRLPLRDALCSASVCCVYSLIYASSVSPNPYVAPQRLCGRGIERSSLNSSATTRNSNEHACTDPRCAHHLGLHPPPPPSAAFLGCCTFDQVCLALGASRNANSSPRLRRLLRRGLCVLQLTLSQTPNASGLLPAAKGSPASIGRTGRHRHSSPCLAAPS
ncbi:hypothetical protein OH77DRAFT_1020618 [Trametes cingulata]|nr:hypothetical protein OH77DRAFT_1020618 [Trametes cingulata]